MVLRLNEESEAAAVISTSNKCYHLSVQAGHIAPHHPQRQRPRPGGGPRAGADATREELVDDERLLFQAGARELFRGASYMTLDEHRLFTLRMECRLEAQQAEVQARRDAADDDDRGLSDDDDSDDLEERKQVENLRLKLAEMRLKLNFNLLEGAVSVGLNGAVVGLSRVDMDFELAHDHKQIHSSHSSPTSPSQRPWTVAAATATTRQRCC